MAQMKRLLGIALLAALLAMGLTAGAEYSPVEFSSPEEKEIYADHGNRLGDVAINGHTEIVHDSLHCRYAVTVRITHEVFVDQEARLVGMVNAGGSGPYAGYEFRLPRGERFVRQDGKGYTEAVFYLNTLTSADTLNLSGVQLGVRLVIDEGGMNKTLATSWYTLP